MTRLVLLLGAALALGGCSNKAPPEAAGAPLRAEPFGAAECAACGMVVREQPSPRAQLVHRDGTRAHFCSVGDLLTYHDTPSPHGKPAAAFVEANDPKALDTNSKKVLLWLNSEAAHFVVGVQREGVMGLPTLAYDEAGAAQRVAKALGGRVVDWTGLQAAARARADR